MNNYRLITKINKLRQWPAVSIHRYKAQRIDTASSSAAERSSIEDDERNEPIHFFGSQAASWRAKDTRSGGSDEHLWYQPYVITACMSIFLLYFCVFREESDIDLKLEGKLFDHVEGLEEVQLTLNYKYNKENGLDNTEVAKRLKELGIDVNLLDGKVAGGN